MRTLHIGSVPFTRYDLQTSEFQALFDVATLPEFPWSEGLFFQTLQNPETEARTHEWFTKAVSRISSLPLTVKIQFPGPLTLQRFGGLTQSGSLSLLGTVLENTLGGWSSANKHYDSPNEEKPEVLVFLDEPDCTDLTPEYLVQILELLRPYPDVQLGIHCCGHAPWELLASGDSPFQILAFDASLVENGKSESEMRNRQALQETDRARVFGLSKNAALSEQAAATLRLLEEYHASERDFLSPPCGLAGETASGALEVARGLIRVNELWQAKHSSLTSNSADS